MSTSLRRELLQRLNELGSFCPEMRFGQLVCLASGGASSNGCGLPQEAEDEAMLANANEALGRALDRLALDSSSPQTRSAVPNRAELLPTLEKVGSQCPEWSFGRLVFNLAALVHVNIYDIEDEELLKGARSTEPGLEWFDLYADRFKGRSTIRDRGWGRQPLYRCPCCRHRTLYDRGGFSICPVCYWEDDGQDDEDADKVRGGPNGVLSLAQARENYSRYGVYDPKFNEHVRPPLPVEM